MEATIPYGLTLDFEESPESLRPRLEAALAAEGFGILTEIDVKATLKKKLDLDRRPYVILGACNPHFAHQALEHEEGLGLVMPCNVAVWETEDGSTTVAAIDVHAMVGVVENPALNEFAGPVNEKLKAAIDAV